jgi:hypothetical protein
MGEPDKKVPKGNVMYTIFKFVGIVTLLSVLGYSRSCNRERIKKQATEEYTKESESREQRK